MTDSTPETPAANQELHPHVFQHRRDLATTAAVVATVPYLGYDPRLGIADFQGSGRWREDYPIELKEFGARIYTMKRSCSCPSGTGRTICTCWQEEFGRAIKVFDAIVESLTAPPGVHIADVFEKRLWPKQSDSSAA